MRKRTLERRYDKYGAIYRLCTADNYVMVRRKGATPFVLPLKLWLTLPTEQQP
jgi:hypothetical protein